MYLRLSAYYFFHFSLLGVMIPFLGLYLNDIGFSLTQIGIVLGLTMGTKLVAPLFWVRLIENTQNPFTWVRWSMILSSLTILALYWVKSFIAVLVIITLTNFFRNAVLPMMEALTLDELGEQSHRYGMIRLWGSVGFIVATGLGGVMVSYFDSQIVIMLMLVFAAGLCMVLMSLKTDSLTNKPSQLISFKTMVSEKPIIILLTMIFLMQLSHGPYYSFYTLYLNEFSIATHWISFLWISGVLAEILFFLIAHRLARQICAKTGLMICFLAAALRWAMIAIFPNSLFLLLSAQLLHAFTFGAFHWLIMRLIQSYFPSQQQAQGQALYSTIGYGVGGGLGGYLSGIIWDHNGLEMIWMMGSISAISGFILAFWANLKFKQKVIS